MWTGGAERWCEEVRRCGQVVWIGGVERRWGEEVWRGGVERRCGEEVLGGDVEGRCGQVVLGRWRGQVDSHRLSSSSSSGNGERRHTTSESDTKACLPV